MLETHHYYCYSILASAAARRTAAEAGQDGTKTVKANAYTGMSLQEAQQILNVQDLESLDLLRKVFFPNAQFLFFHSNHLYIPYS